MGAVAPRGTWEHIYYKTTMLVTCACVTVYLIYHSFDIILLNSERVFCHRRPPPCSLYQGKTVPLQT